MRIVRLALLTILTATTPAGIAWAENPEPTGAPVDLELREITVDLDQRPIRTLRLVEEWTIDYLDESQPVLGRITAAESRGDGTVLLLDSQQGHVFEFGPDGTFRRKLGRTGEGPGETYVAYNVCALPDGRTAIIEGSPPTVVRPGASDIIVLDRQGQPEGQYPIYDINRDGVIPMLVGARFAEGLFMVGVFVADWRQENFVQLNQLMLVGEDGSRVATVAERSFSESMTAMEAREADYFNPFQYYRFDVGREGRIAYVPQRDRYEVVIAGWPGRQGVALRAGQRGRQRSEAEVEDSRKRWGYEHSQVSWVACPRDPVIAQVRFAPNGDLRVYRDARELSQDKREFFAVDVFDRDHELAGRFILDVPGDRETDRLFPLRNGAWVLVRNVNDGEEPAGGVGASVSLLRAEGRDRAP